MDPSPPLAALALCGLGAGCQAPVAPAPDLLSPTAHCPPASLSTACPPRLPPAVCPPPPRALTCPPAGAATRPLRVLLFTRDLVWHHASNCVAAQNLSACGSARGWQVTVSADPAVFTAAGLVAFDVVVFSLTSGQVFDTDAQRAAFRAFIESGKGFAGIHSASYTEQEWPWFVSLVGAAFRDHPEPNLLPGSLLLDDPADPSAAGLPVPWVHCEELYTFQKNPADDPAIHPVVSLDEDCPPYPAALRLGHHPLSWHQAYDGGRSFYTALGHHPDAYYETPLLGHILSGIAWAGGLLH